MQTTNISPYPPARFLAPGLAVAVAVWIGWLILHVPSVAAPPALAAPILAILWLGASAALSARWGMTLRDGLISGLVTSLVCLLLLGSMLVRPESDAEFTSGAAGFHSGALVVAVAFPLAGIALGGLGALIGAALAGAGPRSDAPWLSRLAWVVAASFFPLLLLGGVVTSTESGLAVRDWPSTFGANMFLYPKDLMQAQPRVFFEHTHRLFGTLVGLCTLSFWLATLLQSASRRRYGLWVTALFLAVCVQGYLGGQRVVQQNAYLGAVHGAFGQLLLGFAAVLALWMSPGYASLPAVADAGVRRLRVVATAAFHASILQLLLGVLFRHLRRGDNPGAWHVVWAHAAFALVVASLAIVAGALLIRFGKDNRDAIGLPASARFRVLGVGIHASVGFQFLLGWFVLLAVMTAGSRGEVPTAEQLAEASPVPLAEAVLGTIHQANGAIFLTLIMLAWAWSRRINTASRI